MYASHLLILGSGDVLCLKSLRALFHLKLNSLTLVQRPVAVHLDRGEMYENVFSRLPLYEPITLGSIEPLHSSLFLHFLDLDLEIALCLQVRFLAFRHLKAASTASS